MPQDRPEMRSLELKIPPVVLVALFAAAMWACARWLPQLTWALPVRGALGVLLALAGAAVTLAAVLAFRRHHTTVNPMTPEASSAVVRSGPYRFSRNPMYLGFLLALAGWAVALGNLLSLALLPLFVLCMNRLQIVPEERALRAHFGPEYEQYTGSVRRWI